MEEPSRKVWQIIIKIMKKHEAIEPLPIRLAITREATIVRQKTAKEIIPKQKQSKAVGVSRNDLGNTNPENKHF